MNLRARITLDEHEVTDLLDECSKLVVATVGGDGAPHLSMLYFAVVEGVVAFTTYRTSQKAVNLARDPRITCMVEAGDGYAQLRSAVLYGRARVHDEPDLVLRVGQACASRRGQSAGTDDLRQAMRKRVAVFVDTERVASWDHRKL